MRKFFRIWWILLLAAVSLSLLLFSFSETNSAQASAEPADESPQAMRILVMGRDRAVGLTDTIFVLTVSPESGQASILQIPRDTYANYTQRDYRKLNGALQQLGAENTVASVSQALGVSLDRYLILDLSCLRTLVDSVGGVDVVLPEALQDSELANGRTLESNGEAVHLDGAAAEELVRFRSGYANADLGRLDAQKLFLRALLKQCKTLSPTCLMRVVGSMLMRVQTNLNLSDAVRLISCVGALDAETLPMATLAGEAVQGVSGAWYYVINRAAAVRMVNEYCMPTTPLNETEFDCQGFFDRADHPDFHKIYIAPCAVTDANSNYQERIVFDGRNDGNQIAVPQGRNPRGACSWDL